MANELLESLDKFLKETPKDEIKRLWDSGNYLDEGGFKVSDWLNPNKVFEENYQSMYTLLSEFLNPLDHDNKKLIKETEELLIKIDKDRYEK